MNRKTKKVLRWVGVVALVAVLIVLSCSVMKLNGVFDKKKCNANNLVSIDAIGKANYATTSGNLGHGWSLTVGDLGELKLRGKATATSAYTICQVTLTAGDYMLTSGVSDAAQEGVCIYLSDGTTSYYGDFGGKLTLSAGTYTLYLRVGEDQQLFHTIRPVSVKGTTAGDFYAK